MRSDPKELKCKTCKQVLPFDDFQKSYRLHNHGKHMSCRLCRRRKTSKLCRRRYVARLKRRMERLDEEIARAQWEKENPKSFYEEDMKNDKVKELFLLNKERARYKLPLLDELPSL